MNSTIHLHTNGYVSSGTVMHHDDGSCSLTIRCGKKGETDLVLFGLSVLQMEVLKAALVGLAGSRSQRKGE